MPLEQHPAGLIALLVRDLEHTSTGTDFADWAMHAIEDGYDSPALRQLAGLSVGATPSRFEAKALFDRAAEELRLLLPSSHEALLRAYLGVIAREMLADARTVPDALEIVHKHVLSPLNHPQDLMPWCYLWEGLDPETFASLEDDAVERATRELARKTVERGGDTIHQNPGECDRD